MLRDYLRPRKSASIPTQALASLTAGPVKGLISQMTQLQILIRPLAPEDRPRWTALWQAYLAFYKSDVPAEVYDLTFTRYCDPARADMRAWLAFDGDTPVGLVHSIAHPHGWKTEDVTYLQDLYTVPEARGRGVARGLIETVYADADAAGRGSVYWMTNTDNTTARALYDKIATPTDFMKYARS